MEGKEVVFEDLDNKICCPSCWQSLDVYEKEGDPDWSPKFCPECGQKLIWK